MNMKNQKKSKKLKEREGPVSKSEGEKDWFGSFKTFAKLKLSGFFPLFCSSDEQNKNEKETERARKLKEEHPNIEEMEMAQPGSKVK